MTSINRRSFLSAGAGALAGSQLLPQSSRAEDDKAEEVVQLGRTSNTKFAVNIEMWWTDLAFMDRIRQAAEFGFPAIEFWPLRGKDLDAVAQLTDQLGIEIAQFTAWGFSPGMNNPDNEEQFVQTIESACEAAHQLNSRKMTVVAGNNQEGMTQQAMHAQVIKALQRVAPILEAAEVMAILEPMNGRVDHPGHCLYGSTDALAICRAVDSPMVKINWDLYHMQITEGDLCGRMAEGLDQIGYLQLADHPGRNEPGTGEINYSRVLREAKELGYDDFVGLECRPKTTEQAAAHGVYDADQW